MARICIDARKVEDFGIGTYIRGLLTALSGIESSHHYWLLIGRQQAERVGELGGRFHPLVETSRVYSMKELFSISWALQRLRPHLYHATHYTLPARLPCPAVVTIHDIIHLLYPRFLPNRLAWLYARVMIGRSLRIGSRIVAVSQNTRRDLEDFFGIGGDRLRVVYNGVDEVFRRELEEADIGARLAGLGVVQPYLLFVGNPKPHKNLENLLRAFSRALQMAPVDVRLVCVGGDGSTARWDYLCRRLGVAERVLFLGHVEADALPALYQGALAFVYPTLYEGFGLPLVEAMASGAPVVTSNSSALREIAEGWADLVNPLDVEDIAKAIARCITSEEHRRELSRKSRARAADFEWKKCAEQTLEIYEELIGEGEGSGA